MYVLPPSSTALSHKHLEFDFIFYVIVGSVQRSTVCSFFSEYSDYISYLIKIACVIYMFNKNNNA